MNATTIAPRGLLLVMMEPPAALEEEFNDWYDSEHFPQRLALPGFDTGSRWVCIDGWPRYLAIYDLATATSLETDAYKAVSGLNSTPWSRRILPRMLGRLRVVATQIAPGTAVATPPSQVCRLALACFHVAAAGSPNFVAAWTSSTGGLDGASQARLFHAHADPCELWAITAFDRPVGPDSVRGALGACAGVGADLFNLYLPYWRDRP